LDLSAFLTKISIWSIPVLFAITLHEVAHGWAARYFGDHTAELLGRLSLNPLRHIDPIGTVLVPGLLLLMGGPMFGWAKPVPVATSKLKHPRRASICVALAGPFANLSMALAWCLVLGTIAHMRGSQTLNFWIALMAQAGILINVVLALFNLLPIPPLDGGRVLAGLLPVRYGAGLDRLAPMGLLLVLGLSATPVFAWLFDPAYRAIGRVITVLVRPA
jgi:Zn-dependent protease